MTARLGERCTVRIGCNVGDSGAAWRMTCTSLTCCTARCQATKFPPMGRTVYRHSRIPSGPTLACNRTIAARTQHQQLVMIQS